MAKKKSTALALAKSEELLPEGVEFDELLENLQEMDEINFPRIRFKGGKFKFSDDPDDTGVEEFEGVIFFYGKQNTYWKGNYDPKVQDPPECFSVDGKTGSKPRNEKRQYGDCASCVFNEFGSGQGRGKACRNQLKLYVHRLGSVIPMSLFLAPTSINNFMQNYLIGKVTQKGLGYSRIVTKFKALQKEDETYFRINFEVASKFKDEDAKQVKEFRDYWMKAIKRDRTRLDASVSGGESESSSTRTVEARKPAAVASSADIDEDDDDPPF